MSEQAPSFLSEHQVLYETNPRAATLAWFRQARFGLFIHYGLYSLLGRGEWAQFHECIPIAQYAKLKDKFKARGFAAEALADLALASGFRYVTMVAKHCDSFCLWDTKQTDFNSMTAPSKRDLVGEMAAACAARGLGFFIFYEHGFDWRHPHGPAPWEWPLPTVRPPYDPPDPWFATPDEYYFGHYLDYVREQITELLTQYGPVAGIWLDGAAVPASGDPARFHLAELYAHIRQLQPQALIGYKWGVTGAEDFLAPEEPQLDRVKSADKPLEICTSLQRRLWGYVADDPHLAVAEVLPKIELARVKNANLLLNVGPMGDGSLAPEAAALLKELAPHLTAV